MANVRHFYREEQLTRLESMLNDEFARRFPGEKGVRCDGFKKRVGYTADHRGPFPVQRVITFKRFPTLHECNARCMGGNPNGTCECSCGGRNHGLGAILAAEQSLSLV
jgi:hypothetical protein